LIKEDIMTTLPVREMVLYKHGVGFFVRQGEVEGVEATLTFRAEEVNDILKSLAVFDRAGGQVYGVHYQTPMDRAHRLANTSIRLGNDASVTQLFQQLRGRQVMLVVEDSKNKQMTYIGRVIGTEKQSLSNLDAVAGKHFVSLLGNDGATHIFPFDNIRQFTIKDDQSKQDLTYFLDTSMSEDNRRTVTVRMSEGEHDLVVNYVAPSPTWRVSYRLVAEAEDDGSTGKALLQGWGLFDNRLEEDLEEVKVTLVAGQPISFIYDLYESKIPERPLIKDESRVVEAPVEYKAEARLERFVSRRAKSAPAPMAEEVGIPDWLSDDGGDLPFLEALEESTLVSAEGKETGETFQYSVTTPVTVKRGESALVPILSHIVNYERELLYNQAKLPDHPVASLRFENQTGLTLERGPVTVVEDGDYKGEAIIPFTKDQNAVYVPYAVELGVTVKEVFHRNSELRGLSIDGEYLKQQLYSVYETTYTIENATTTDKVVTVEAPKQDNFDLFDTPEPDATTLNERRWKIAVSANETSEFVRKERQMQWQNQALRNMNYFNLDAFLENKYIDSALVDNLRDILDAVQSIADMTTETSEREQEQKSLYEKQEQLRKNMRSLGSSGKEGTLRQRVVDQLESSQDRLESIDSEIADLKSAILETEANITSLIEALGEKYPSE
jgi:hypothetical protein